MQLTKEHTILSVLYHFRCLSFSQIHELCFSGLSERTCSNALSKMATAGTIIKSGFRNDGTYYSITKNGIAYLRSHGLIPLDRKKEDILYTKKLYSASAISLNPQYAPHQLALNQFVIDFMQKYPDIPFEYYDEKYISQVFSDIRPDGILRINNCLYFLEMDRNTERESRLMKKWESYRRFLKSDDYYVSCNDIKVLFILDNISDNSVRKQNLREYIDKNLRSEIGNSFNLYIGKKEHLLNLFNMTSDTPDLFRKHGFIVSQGYFPNTALPLYTSCIQKENLEFTVDDFTDENMFVYKKLLLYPKYNTAYSKLYNSDMKYIIVTNSETEAYYLSRQTQVSSSNIYFTTRQRLQDYTFPSALFQIGANRILYHFADEKLRVAQEEAYINSFFK